MTELELHLGDLVAIADGSAYQGHRGTVVVLGAKEVVVELLTGERYTVGWWKDVQPVQDAIDRDSGRGDYSTKKPEAAPVRTAS